VSLIADVIKTNKSLVYLDVSNNKFGNVGLIAIAESLKSNSTLIELSVIGQSQPFGEASLQKMTEMFEFNITLQKINWRLHSRQSFALNKLISRNVDINRRIAAGQKLDDYINLVPVPKKSVFGVAADYIAGEGGAHTAPAPTAEPSHTAPAPSHTEPAHSHTEPAPSHTEPAHSHTEPAHSHTEPAHSHTEPAHSHTESHSTTTAHESEVPSSTDPVPGGEQEKVDE